MRRLGAWAAALGACLLLLGSAGAAETPPTFLFSFGSPGRAEGQFVQPFGIAIEGSAGNVYVADTQNDRVQVFTASGGFIRAFGGPTELSKPVDVAVDRGPPYNVYVTDTNNHRIRKYTPDGRLVQTFGSIGTRPGELTLPRALVVEPDGNLLVGEPGRITRFSASGSFLASWGSVGSGDGQFRYLSDLSVDGAGNVYTIDRDLSRVQKFDPSGTYLSQWGSRGSGDGQFLSPGAITVDGSSVYVSDSGNARLQKFTLEGQFLSTVGTRGQGPGQFVAPAGLEVSPLPPRNLYVVEFTGCCSRVQVFRLAVDVPPPVPPPVAGRSVNVAPVSGTVRVRPRGTSTFVPLTAGMQIPAGSEIDVTAGRIRLTSAAKAGKTQTSDFYSGRFVVTQAKTGPTTLRLSAPLACPKRTTSSSRTVLLKKRRLWGNGKGSFRTRARFAAATVRGTIWLTEDTCTTTTVRVVRGKVAVSDFVLRKTILVTAGKSYVARRR
jgi:DNA-binding beta-propeller fold protein YncE